MRTKNLCVDCLHLRMSSGQEPCKSCILGWRDGYKPDFAASTPSDPDVPHGCTTCRYRIISSGQEPCKSCVHEGKDGYEPNECNTCRYVDVEANDDPCCFCYNSATLDGRTEWKTDDPESEPDCDTCEYADRHLCDPHCPKLSDFRTVPQEDAQEAAEDDSVSHPGHYTTLPLEAIEMIRLALTEAYGVEGFEAYCFGNELKYRLRAGFKGDAQEDIGKALKYEQFRKNNFE